MKSRLDVASIKTIESPMVHCTVNAIWRALPDRGVSMVPMKGTAAPILGMRFITGGAMLHNNKSVGKIASFALGPIPVFLEVSLFKVGGGYTPTRRNLYVRADISAPEGAIDVRVGQGYLTALRGPMQLLTGAEAKAAFQNNFKEGAMFNPNTDCALLGVSLRGDILNAPVRASKTVDDFGMEATVIVRRRRREIEV